MEIDDLDLLWVGLQATLGIPALLLLWHRRGRPDDLVPRGGPCADRWGIPLALGLFAASILLTAVGALVLGIEHLSTSRLLLLDGTAKLGTLGFAWVLLRSRVPPAAPGPAPFGPSLRAGVLAGFAFLPLGIVVVLLQRALLSLAGEEMKAQAIVEAAVEGPAPVFLLVAVVAVVVAPLFEEVLFRGFLYAGLRAFTGPVASALVTAALFSAVHMERDALPITFVLGLCLAFLRERTGGRTAPIAMHACYNAWQVGGMLLLRLYGTPGG